MTTPLTHPLLATCTVAHGFGQRGCSPPPGLLLPRQVHGGVAARAGPSWRRHPPEADAVVSTFPGRPVGVVTADCVPVLAATRDGAAVVAIHAGWRGLAGGIVAAGVAALREAAPPGVALHAVIGPHIGPCCYEIDAPVVEALAARFGPSYATALRESRPGHHWLDLAQLVRRELETEIDAACIGALPDACTRCDRTRFHSVRRDGPRAGRLVHFVAARAGTAGAAFAPS